MYNMLPICFKKELKPTQLLIITFTDVLKCVTFSLANPVTQTFENNVTETINYNERFHWDWRQGRLGFGPFGKLFSASPYILACLIVCIGAKFK